MTAGIDQRLAGDLPDGTPPEVRDRATRPARVPETDPTLGIVVNRPAHQRPAAERLVVLGDSLTQGMRSAAVHDDDLSFAAILARQLGVDDFRAPAYPGLGGLPVNIEYLLRTLEDEFGPTFSAWEVPLAAVRLHSLLADIQRFWERGPGIVPPPPGPPPHTLAVLGWDLRDALARTFDINLAQAKASRHQLLAPIVENAGPIAALRIYPHGDPDERASTLPTVAAGFGDIETLVVMLGSNNALGAMVDLRVAWSTDAEHRDLVRKNTATVWRPEHFRAEYDLLMEQVQRARARHVVLATVPHVTIPPIARGVGGKRAPGSAYFRFYTRPWIDDDDFEADRDPHVTGEQAQAVDTAIDLYNEHLTGVVRAAREQGRDWYLFDLCGLLDRLAWRRYIDDPESRPEWWTEYPLPAPLAALTPKPDTRFLHGDRRGGRAQGGIFSLDGIHPTVVSYGIIAQELAAVLRQAGVEFRSPAVDFDDLIARDSLIRTPPQSITSALDVIGWLDDAADLLVGLWPFRADSSAGR